jgi:hypothetical protein
LNVQEFFANEVPAKETVGQRHFVNSGTIHSSGLPKSSGQLRDIRRYAPPRLIFAEQLGRRAATGFAFIIDVAQRLTLSVPNVKQFGVTFVDHGAGKRRGVKPNGQSSAGAVFSVD